MEKPIRVLIVDDEERFRTTTANILKRRGFDAIAVGSGPEAIEAVKRDGIDVVILDIKMPGMDGHEALREIKRIRADIAVIMLTGHGTPDSAMRGLADGVFDYLGKPCPIDLLASKIVEAHSRKGPIREVEPRVKDIMTPLSVFSTIGEEGTMAEAVLVLLKSFTEVMGTGTVHETVHRSILVLNRKGDVIGIITLRDLLRALQPPYMRLLTEKPAMAEAIRLEAPSFSGMFTIMTRDLAKMKVKDNMSVAPPTIPADANLMEAASRLLYGNLSRMLVEDRGKVVGVLREQDLFFEMGKILKGYGSAGEEG